MKARLLLVVAAVAITASCFPYPYVERPGTFGTVIDAETGAPIADATVTLNMHWRDGSVYHSTSTTTDTKGRFEFAPHYVWGPFVVTQELSPPVLGTLEAKSATYSNVAREISVHAEGHTPVAVGDIRLTKLK